MILLSLFVIVASLFNKDMKGLIGSLAVMIAAIAIYSFMYYKAITFVYDGSYYCVNSWKDFLGILSMSELLGVGLWCKTLYNTFKK